MNTVKKLIANVILWAVIGIVVSVILELIGRFADIEIAFWVYIVIICALGGITNWQVAEFFDKKN